MSMAASAFKSMYCPNSRSLPVPRIIARDGKIAVEMTRGRILRRRSSWRNVRNDSLASYLRIYCDEISHSGKDLACCESGVK